MFTIISSRRSVVRHSGGYMEHRRAAYIAAVVAVSSGVWRGKAGAVPSTAVCGPQCGNKLTGCENPQATNFDSGGILAKRWTPC